MSNGTPDSLFTACPSCPCPQLDRLWEHVQWSVWSEFSQARELLDHVDGCGHWLKAVSAGAAADQLVDWVERLSKDFSLQRTSGLFKQLGENDLWSALLDLCPAGNLCDGLKGLLLMGFVRHSLGELSLRVLQRGSFRSQVMDWHLRRIIKFTMRELFQHQSTRPLFRESVTECLELDDADGLSALCDEWRQAEEPDSREMICEDLKFAYSAATEKRPHFVAKLAMIKRFGYSDNRDAIDWLLLDTIIEKKAWSALPALWTSQSRLMDIEVLRKCLHKMLPDQALWPGMAPALDQWAPEMWDLTMMNLSANWHKLSNRLSRWCVGNGHPYLAFLLALTTKDAEQLDRVMTTFSSLRLRPYHLWCALQLYDTHRMVSSMFALLKTHPGNAEVVQEHSYLHRSDLLVKACEREDLMDWVLVLRCTDLAYIKHHHQSCRNQAVLDGILEVASGSLVGLSCENWDIVRVLVGRCTHTSTPRSVLARAAFSGQVDIVESLLSRVDPTIRAGSTSLLYAVCEGSSPKEAKLEMTRLCVGSGLSTFQRNSEGELVSLFPGHTVPGLVEGGGRVAYFMGNADLVKLTIAAGTYSKKYLYDRATAASESFLQNLHASNDPMFPEFEMTCRVVCEAASTPCRLIHQARLVVSHCIGCRPGRSDRIHKLPLPLSLKNMLSFKDVLECVCEPFPRV